MKDKQKRKELMETLRTLKAEELKIRESDETEQLFWLKFKAQGGQAENSSSLKKARRNVARIKTLRRAAELKVTKGV